jgi:hypothetical protein
VIATSGSDSNPCTLASPCATIAHAAALAAPGNNVYARAGTYTFSVEQDIGVAGTSSQHIVIAGYPGDAVPVFTGGVKQMFGVLLRTTSTAAYLDFSGITLDCGVAGFGDYATMTNTSPAACGYPFVSDAGSNNLTFEAVTFDNARQQGFVLNGSPVTMDHIDVHHTAWDNNAAAPTCDSSCSSTGAPWRTSSGSGGGGWPSATTPIGGVFTITNSTIHENDGEGLLLGGTTDIVRNNILYDNFSTQIGCDGVSGTCTVDGNIMYTTQTAEYERYRFSGYAPSVNIGHDTEGGPNGSVITTNNIAYGGWINFSQFNSGNDPRCWTNFITVGNTFANPIGPAASFQTNVSLNENSTTCGTQSGNVWRDNIAYVDNGNPQTSNTAGTNTSFDHNLWFGGSGGTWAGGTGDLTSDPLFEGVLGSTAANYKLKPASPAIGAGVSISTWTTIDFGGNPRPDVSSHYDIGAWNVTGP